MSIVEEKLNSYEAYKDRLTELEKAGASKNRVVFLFRQAEGSNALHEVLDDVRKKGVSTGILIHVLIPNSEFANPNCPYKQDSKFKVTVLPYAVVFNSRHTLGRNWIHKNLVGEAAFTELKVLDLFK